MGDVSEPVIQCDWCGKYVPDDASVVVKDGRTYCEDCAHHFNISRGDKNGNTKTETEKRINKTEDANTNDISNFSPS